MPGSKTILVVEDEGVVARQLQLSLIDLGYRVPATAASADEAYQLAERHHPDLVLMDIHLDGGTDGIEAAGVLRARFAVPIIYLTAYADAATVEKAKVTEPYAYLIKPIDASKLTAAVEVALYKHELDQKLRLSEAKFSGIVSLSVDAIITLDEKQRITLFNDGAEAIFGYSKAEVLGQPLDVLLPDRLGAIHREHVARFASGPTHARPMGQRELAISGKRKTGEEFPADASISKLTVGGKSLLAVVLRDISDRKRVENEQRFLSQLGAVLSGTLEYEETLVTLARMVVGEIADWCALDLVEPDGRVRRIKVASADPAKASIAELLERIPLDRSKPDLVWEVLATKESVLVPEVTAEMLESVAQSEEHLAMLRAADIRSAMAVPLIVRGQLIGALVFASSRPSRHHGANDLRLAEDVAHRAALAIENARLYRAAQRAIEARDDVLGIVAHDLRNPLNSIILQTELLRIPGTNGSGPVDRIKHAAHRMNRLIQDLLDVTRMEAGQLSIAQDRIPASRVVSEAVEAQRALIASTAIELRIEIARDLPEVWADLERLLQVFENLIGNAVKFTERGGRITIGAAPRDRDVLFWITDTGAGIAPEDVPHLFDRFWQAHKAGRQSAGLGLSIVKGIVEPHGGRIWVESTHGRGSTFFFTIPMPPRSEDRRAEPSVQPRPRDAGEALHER